MRTAWPPNWLRIAAIAFIAGLSSWREVKRAKSDAAMTFIGTAFSIAASLFARFVSQQDDSPAMKAVAAMRNQFGGHAVRTEAPPGGDASAG